MSVWRTYGQTETRELWRIIFTNRTVNSDLNTLLTLTLLILPNFREDTRIVFTVDNV